MATYITLVGKRASGKDTFADYVSQRYDIPSIRFSTVITQLGVEFGIIKSEEMQDKGKGQYVGNTLRRLYGERFYTERLARQIQGVTHTINEARHPEEVACLRDTLGEGVVLVGLISDSQERYERARRIGVVSSDEHFKELEDNPAETNIDLLLQQADRVLSNNGLLEEFYNVIDEFIRQVKLDNI